MEIGILMTARCNAACAHCSTGCGPHRTESLGREEIIRLMDQVAAIPMEEPLKFSLSGGEVFLDLPLLLEVVAHGHRLGAEVTCVTNGFWGASDARAEHILSQLKSAGLSHFAVSVSKFHKAYVPFRRVETVVRAAQKLGVPCSLKFVSSPSDRAHLGDLRRWAIEQGCDGVQDIPLLPYPRLGASLPDDAYERHVGLPKGRCPYPVVTVAEDGNAYSCCTPGANVEALRLGSIRNQDFEQIQDRFAFGGLQAILRDEGPAAIALQLRGRDLSERLRPAYGSVCDLCTHLLNDPQLAAAASALGNRRERDRALELMSHIDPE